MLCVFDVLLCDVFVRYLVCLLYLLYMLCVFVVYAIFVVCVVGILYLYLFYLFGLYLKPMSVCLSPHTVGHPTAVRKCIN